MVVTTDENSLPVSENVARSPDAKTVQLLSKVGECTPSQDKASPRFLIASSPVLHRGVATPQRRADSACVLNEVEPRVTLETYKDVIDSTTEVVEADADLPDEGRDLENCEWKDPTTGALLGYAAIDEDACEEMSADDVTAAEAVDESIEEEEEDEEAALPLQVTVEWQQQATGIMMGYALCGDDEEDIQAMSQLFEEQDEEVETVQSQPDEEETPSTDEWTDACGENASEWVDAHSGVAMAYECDDESDFGEHASAWVDANSGVAMAYERDDESDFGEHLVEAQKREAAAEWKDPITGALLAYACDEDSDFGDHIQDDDIELGRNEKEPVGYGYGYGDASSESDSDASPALRKPVRRSRKCRRGFFKQHRGLLLLRLRSQQIRRVIKGSQFRKNK